MQLEKWWEHAKLTTTIDVLDALGVRDVRGLQFVSSTADMPQMRPVQQARMRWALGSYQRQLAQEQKDRDEKEQKERHQKERQQQDKQDQKQQGKQQQGEKQQDQKQQEQKQQVQQDQKQQEQKQQEQKEQKQQGEHQQGKKQLSQKQQGERQQNERERAEARQTAINNVRPAASQKVAAAYAKFGFLRDVHGFFQQLSQDYLKLDAS